MTDIITFKKIFEDFLNSDYFGALSFFEIAIGLIITLVISLFIFFVYKETYGGVMYSHSFNVCLVLMALITSVIISTISSNLVLSLGMVGALSIVRFRTPVKDPLDIVFLFWAIAVGITTGARLYVPAITGSIFIGIVAMLLLRYSNKNNIFLLIIHCEEDAKESIYRKIQDLDYTLKSKTVSNEITEFSFEVKTIGADTSFVEEISEIEGIQDVSLITYNGNFVG